MTDIGDASSEDRKPLPEPWGIWATLGWVVLAFVLSSVAGFATVAVWRPDALMGSTDLLRDGPLLSLTTDVSAIVQIGLLAWAARLAGWRVNDYLALNWSNGRIAVILIVALMLFLVGFDGLTYLLGRDVVTPFQVDTYRTARDSGALPLLWLTFVVLAPVAEEIMFRGFLYRGWVRSERSAIPGVLIISALFAAIHIQYDWFGILQVFFIGLLLAIARWRTGSTLLTILMHVLANFWATIESMIKVEWLP
jgi:uncharacterized protein